MGDEGGMDELPELTAPKLQAHRRDTPPVSVEDKVAKMHRSAGSAVGTDVVDDESRERLDVLEETIRSLQLQVMQMTRKAAPVAVAELTKESFPTFMLGIDVLRGESPLDHMGVLSRLFQRVLEEGDDGEVADTGEAVEACVNAFPEDAHHWVGPEDAPPGVYIVTERGVCPEVRLFLSLFHNRLPFYNETSEEGEHSNEKELWLEQRRASCIFVHLSHSPLVPDMGLRALGFLVAHMGAGHAHIFRVESAVFSAAIFDDEIRRPNVVGPIGSYTERQRMQEVWELVEMMFRAYQETCKESKLVAATRRILTNRVGTKAHSASAYIASSGRHLLGQPSPGAFRRTDIIGWFLATYKSCPPHSDAAYAIYMIFLLAFSQHTLAGSVSEDVLDELDESRTLHRLMGEANMFRHVAVNCTRHKTATPEPIVALMAIAATFDEVQ